MLGKNIASKELSCEKYLRRIPEAALNTDSNTVACCKLRIRKRVRSRLELLKDEQRRYEEQELGTKQKEKTIGEVVEKVALWRKMYAGFKDEKDEVVRMDLETAAKEIGIVKKTLDDYLLQIRNGKRFGFNFQKRFQEKIG